VGDKAAKLIVVFPHIDPYSRENTTYLDGSRQATVTDEASIEAYPSFKSNPQANLTRKTNPRQGRPRI